MVPVFPNILVMVNLKEMYIQVPAHLIGQDTYCQFSGADVQ